MREPLAELTIDDVTRASVAAERHVLAAQNDDGRFRYILQPFTGKVTWKGFAVPRQAGTTLTLCELGSPTAPVTRAARRSLAMLAGLERPAGDVSGLVYDEPGRPARRWASLGDTALPLIAFLTCRPRTGPAHDVLIARLAGFLLAMQRPDGGFHPRFDLDRAAPIPGPQAPAYDPAANVPQLLGHSLRAFLITYQSNAVGDFWPLFGGRKTVGRSNSGDTAAIDVGAIP